MKRLRRTSRVGSGRGAHHHIVFIDDDGKIAEVGFSGGHNHEYVWEDGVEAETDPSTGEVIAEGTEGRWIMLPDPDDGHTHEVEEYEVRQKKGKEKDDQVVRDVVELFRVGTELEKESLDKGRESEDFYFGKQWNEVDKRELESQGRPCLTVNLTAPKIDHLSGEQRQARTDIHFLPVESGDQRACDLYNIVAKKIQDACRFDREESKVFVDELITGRGLFNLYVDFTHNLFGEIKIERFPWEGVRFGPHEKEDLSDCEYVVKHRVFSKSKIEQLWPDKAEDIGKDFDAFETLGNRHVTYANDQYAMSDNTRSVLIGGEAFVDISKKEFRVLECWRKTYIDASVAVHVESEWTESLVGWDRKDVKQLSTMQGVVVVPKSEQRIRISRVAGGVLLSDENPADLPVHDFFIVPAYAYKRGNSFKGKVEDVKDPQQEINKRHSQAIDIVNKVASYGYGYDDNTFPDPSEVEKFKRIAATPGFVTKLNDSNRPPHVFQGVKFPSEITQLMQMDMDFFDRILNIQPRQAGANTSAAAIIQEQKMKLIGNEFLFDNLWFAKSKIGQLLLHTIRRYYSPERIFRIVNNSNQNSPVKIGGDDFDQYSYEEIIAILENADVTQFDVVVSESTYSPTTRIAILTMLQELIRNGAQVPPEMLVKYFDLPEHEKKKIIETMQQAQEAESQASQQTGRTEILKTLVGQGIIPPEVEEQFGLGQQQEQPPAGQPAEVPTANNGLAGFS